MPVHGEIKKEYEPWKAYHGKEDVLTPTHSVLGIDGPLELYNVAMEIPTDEKFHTLTKWMQKEVDTATRFSLTDGIIQIEIELWDGDESQKIYFCGDLTLKDSINLSKSRYFSMGFVPVGKPRITIGAVRLYKKEDLIEIIRIKQRIDARAQRPTKWKVG
jgi:hypothetical protein